MEEERERERVAREHNKVRPSRTFFKAATRGTRRQHTLTPPEYCQAAPAAMAPRSDRVRALAAVVALVLLTALGTCERQPEARLAHTGG